MITFNEVNLANHMKINDIRRSIMPSRVISTIDIRGRHGAYFQNLKHDPLVIEADVTILASSMTEFRAKVREIAGYLHTEEPTKLSFHDEPDKYYEAMVIDDSDLSEVSRIGKGTIKFVCFSPFAISVEESNFNVLTSENAFYYSNGGTLMDNGSRYVSGQPILDPVKGLYMPRRYVPVIKDYLLSKAGIPDWAVFENSSRPAVKKEVQVGNGQQGIGNTYYIETKTTGATNGTPTPTYTDTGDVGIQQNLPVIPYPGGAGQYEERTVSVWVKANRALPSMWITDTNGLGTNIVAVLPSDKAYSNEWVRLKITFNQYYDTQYVLNVGWKIANMPSNFRTLLGHGFGDTIHQMWFYNPQYDVKRHIPPMSQDGNRTDSSLVNKSAVGQLSGSRGSAEFLVDYPGIDNFITDGKSYLFVYGGAGEGNATLSIYVSSAGIYVKMGNKAGNGYESTISGQIPASEYGKELYIALTWNSTAANGGQGTTTLWVNGIQIAQSGSTAYVPTVGSSKNLSIGSDTTTSGQARWHSFGSYIKQVKLSSRVLNQTTVNGIQATHELDTDDQTTGFYDFRTGDIENLMPDMDAKYVGGTAPTTAKITATFLQDATYFSVGTDELKVLLGSEDKPISIPGQRPTMINQYDPVSGATNKFSTMGAWWLSGISDNGTTGISAGAATAGTSEQYAIFPTGRTLASPSGGSAYLSRGLALKEAQVDVSVTNSLRMKSTNVASQGIMKILLVSSARQTVASLTVEDLYGSNHFKEVKFHLHQPNGSKITLDGRSYMLLVEDDDFYLETYISRRGTLWTVELRPRNLDGSYVGGIEGFTTLTYDDVNGMFSDNIKEVHFVFGAVDNKPIHEVMEFYNFQAQGTGQNPIINTTSFRTGDILEIDGEYGTVKLNGIDRMDLLDPMTTFFALQPGRQDNIKAYPIGATDTIVRYNKRWL